MVLPNGIVEVIYFVYSFAHVLSFSERVDPKVKASKKDPVASQSYCVLKLRALLFQARKLQGQSKMTF